MTNQHSQKEIQTLIQEARTNNLENAPVVELKRNQGKFLPVIPDIEIDPRVLIDCPATLPKVRYAARSCPTCEHFDGIAQKGWTDDPTEVLDWDVQYCIRCRYPMERTGKILVVVDEVIEP